jgi:glutathione S-transferase
MGLKIVLGNKNYSSWSLRGWLALEMSGLPYEEIIVPLDQPETTPTLAKLSASGRVPALIDEAAGITVCDSLAICERLAEAKPDLWPADASARAIARSVSAEMHSGFAALRTHCPMNIRASLPRASFPDDVKADVARIVQIWADCRAKYGAGGAFLFGAPTIADAMFAPVVTRFRTYGITTEGEAVAYAQAIWTWAPMQKWIEAAKAEPWKHSKYDV